MDVQEAQKLTEAVASSRITDEEETSSTIASSSDARRCLGDDVPLTAGNTPNRPVTRECNHEHEFCWQCLATSINTQMQSRRPDEIDCPSCLQRLSYADMQEFADRATFER